MLRKTELALFRVTVAVLCVSAWVGQAHGQGWKQPRPLITERVEENKLITLTGNLRPEARADNDRGPAADSTPMEHMLLQLRRSPEQEQALEELIEQLHTPGSPNFHRWLTPQGFGERFGPAPEDLATITGWLESHGLTINVVYPSGMLIDFSGTAGQIRRAFRTPIHQLEVNGVRHIANMGEPQIPAALAAAVQGVVSLHDFLPHTMRTPRAEYSFTSGTSTTQAVVPADLATIYNLNPLFNAGISGQGQTVVVIEDSNVFSTDDWVTFRSTFGLAGFTSGSFSQVHPAPPSGSNNCSDPGVNGDEGEAILDAEYASAAAPGAAIEVASCKNTTTFGGLIALQNLINGSSPPPVVSISYGECEALNGATANAAYRSAYQQAVAEGVSVFVSSGDEGAASCDAGATKATHGIGVSAFASTPYNVAVGGTDFGDTFAGSSGTYWNSTNTASFGSAKSYIPEIPWNDSCAGVLLATYVSGSGTTYGSNGFCNTSSGQQFLTTASGSGGPSGCATGTPSTSGVVSGSCAGYAKPSWQALFGNPSDGVRDIPDVSLFAANGIWGHYFIFCDSDTGNGGVACTGAPSGWSGAGGTSFSAPIMAGIQALVNQRAGGRQGNPNSIYYSLAASEYGASGNSSCNSTLGNGAASSCIFYDVTQGDMDVNCTGSHNCYLPSGTRGVLSTSNSSYSPAFTTTAGWDFATGIGTVNAANLVNNWPTPNFTLSANPSSVTITQGAPGGTTTITVNQQNGFHGSVSLSASGLPAGVTASFNPASTTTTSTLTLSANTTATVGTVNITVTGTSGSLTNPVQISLTVLAQTWSISGTITNGGGATVTLSGSANAVTTADGSGNYSFSSLANGTYTVTPAAAGLIFTPASRQVTLNSANVAGVNFTAQMASLVPHTIWSVTYADSQETSCENGAAANAIDGNPSTKWVTQWCPSSAPPPHEIQINLGASYTLSAFQYLARQDGCANGWIKQYAFYVSSDGVNWGTAVATGTFSYGGLSTACPGGGVPSALQVNFTPVTGQYVRLQA
ncbi:MAG TPA: protease pro-enzyme activation domain-containing protein, partial [Terriglobales bacterium]|nr:protease pro-enzyme activation domain-containing protein [Terriglobales bacterium]